MRTACRSPRCGNVQSALCSPTAREADITTHISHRQCASQIRRRTARAHAIELLRHAAAGSPFQHSRRPPVRLRRGAASAVLSAAAGVEETKHALLEAVRGTNRGIFGVQAEQRRLICGLIEQLEAASPVGNITEHLHRVGGDWRLLFSTISITGKRRTKLGLRQFITLGDFTQSIDLEHRRAINQIEFNVSGIAFLNGTLRVEASYGVASPQRVDIDFESATLKPIQLQELFEQNFELLLSIFNPAGWLDITFVDKCHRVGRDDKGNVFLLERL